ncbi:hypothetical protein Tco_0816495 [Tanacetum coccineum]
MGWVVRSDAVEKSTDNADFDKIVDFLNANPIRYSLTVSPTIYVSYIEQFCSTAKIKTINNQTQRRAKVNEPILTVASSSHQKTQTPRQALTKVTELSQTSEPIPHVVDEAIYVEWDDIVERAGNGSGGRPRSQDTMRDRPAQTRFERLSKKSNDLPFSRVNTLGSGEDSLELINKLMETCTKLSKRILALENINTAQALEITNLKKRVKRLEKKKNLRTSHLKRRLFKVRIESSTKKKAAETQGNAPVTTAGVSISAAEPSTPLTTINIPEEEEITIAQSLIKMKSEKSKGKSVTIEESSETATRLIVLKIDPKDKGKAKMVEPKKLKKKKDHIQIDKEVAQKLQAELDEEVKLERLREEEEACNAVLLEEWDNNQAMIDADYELAIRLSAKEHAELNIEERSKLFMELMNIRKKHFARLGAEEQRRKPLTKAQRRNQIRKKAESSKKRSREEIDEERVKKQKMEDDAKKANLKDCLEIVSDSDKAISVEVLETKSPIVDWKIHSLGIVSCYIMERADGRSKMYKFFSEMLRDFDRQDLLDMYRLVKEKYKTTRPEAKALVFWGNFMTMFEPSEEDEI